MRGPRILPILLIVQLAACQHVQLVSTYDRTTEEEVTALHAKLSALFELLESSDPSPSYESVAGRYAELRHDLGELSWRNRARLQNDTTNGQLEALTRTLDQLEAVHRTEGRLSREAIGPNRETFDSLTGAILVLELRKQSASSSWRE